MDVLKKIKGTTLVETIVASVVIALVFGLATMLVNSVLKTTATNDTSASNYALNKLMYQYKNKAVEVPFREEFDTFEILAERRNTVVVFQVIKNGKPVKNQLYITNP